MTDRKMFLSVAIMGLALGGCSTISLDKDRAAEARKQELCRDIATRDQPQCVGAFDREPQKP